MKKKISVYEKLSATRKALANRIKEVPTDKSAIAELERIDGKLKRIDRTIARTTAGGGNYTKGLNDQAPDA